MFKTIRLLFFIGLLVFSSSSLIARAATNNIDVMTVKGVVNPVLADYVKRGIEHAESTGAEAVIIQIDTPGGLDTSMRDIVQEIVSSQVPVVVYVSPAGARAASAGVFITISAHVAAMAPNTAIGAAHPVSLGGDSQTPDPTMEEKVLNDAVAYIKSIAEAHGRNVEWAEQAVRESVSVTETEALDLNVIDLIAPDLDSLVRQLDGREVEMLGGAKVTLDTADTVQVPVPMSATEQFLYAISDPNIAYLLLSLATLGIFVEISNPGLIFPGIIGAICLLMALYSLGTLPVNYAGILFIVLAFALFIGEILTTSFGVFTAGGIVSLILGSLILFKGGPLFRVNPWLIGSISVVIAGVFFFVIRKLLAAHHYQVSTGWEELIGKPARVVAALEPEGMVLFRGERWKAVSRAGNIQVGEDVKIEGVENLKLYVTTEKGNGEKDGISAG